MVLFSLAATMLLFADLLAMPSALLFSEKFSTELGSPPSLMAARKERMENIHKKGLTLVHSR